MKGITLALWLLLAFTGCRPDESRLILTLSDLPQEVQTLRVTLRRDGAADAVREYRTATTIGVLLPRELQGTLGLQVAGLAADRCVLAEGEGRVALSAPGRSDGAIAMHALAQRRCPVEVTRSGEGSVVSAPAGLDCGERCLIEAPVGSPLQLTATPAPGAYFVGFGGACQGAAPCALTPAGPVRVSARFDRNTLTVARAGGGRVLSAPAGLDCGPTCSAAFPVGTTVTLTAQPDSGAYFAGWSGACTGLLPCPVTLLQPAQVSARFEPNTLGVKRLGNGTGQVRSEPAGIDCGATCSAAFASGTRVKLQATPDAPYYFVGWGGACSGVGECLVTLERAGEVTATFSKNTFQVTKSGGGAGRITSAPAGIDCGATCSADFPAGTALRLSATADPGSAFTGFGGACSGATCDLTLTGPAQVSATFAPLYTVAVNRTGTASGTITSEPAGIACGGACSASFPAGVRLKLQVKPDANAVFLGWSGGCQGMGHCEVTLGGPLQATAEFAPKVCGTGKFCWEHPLPSGNVPVAVWAQGPSNAWAVGRYGTVLRWNGSAWSRVESGTVRDLYAVWGSGANDVWIGGAAGTLLRWNGTALAPVGQGIFGSNPINAIWGTGPNQVLVGSDDLYEWNGSAWGKYKVPDWYGSLWGNGANSAWAVSWSKLMKWTGFAFVNVPLPVPAQRLAGIGGLGGELWLFRHYDTALRSTDGGTTWAETTFRGGAVYSVWSSGADLWVVQDDKTVMRYDGAQWQDLTPAGALELEGVGGSGAGDVWVVGPSGPLRWSGAAWTDSKAQRTQARQINRMWASGANDIYATDVAGQILHYDGRLWEVLPNLSGSGVWGSSARDVWVTSGNALRHYDGSAWTLVPSGASRPLYAIWGSAASSIWAVGDSGTLVRFDGASWRLVPGPGTATLATVHGSGPSDVWAGGGAALWRFDGSQWSALPTGIDPAQRIDRILVAAPGDAWVTTNWSTLYRYQGGALVPVAGAPVNALGVFGTGPNDIWVIGGTGGVASWNGTLWTQLDLGTSLYMSSGYRHPTAGTFTFGQWGAILRYQP